MLHDATYPIFQQSYPRYTCPPTGSISSKGQDKLREIPSPHKWGHPLTQLVVGRAYLQLLLYIAHICGGGRVTSPTSRPASQIPHRVDGSVYKTDRSHLVSCIVNVYSGRAVFIYWRGLNPVRQCAFWCSCSDTFSQYCGVNDPIETTGRGCGSY